MLDGRTGVRTDYPEIAQLPADATGLFASIAGNSTLAVLEMHYSAAADEPLDGRLCPTNNWTRDDRLGGLASSTGQSVSQSVSQSTFHFFFVTFS